MDNEASPLAGLRQAIAENYTWIIIFRCVPHTICLLEDDLFAACSRFSDAYSLWYAVIAPSYFA